MFWYTREVDRNEADAASELAMVKQREQDLMMEVGWGETGYSLCFACLAAAYSRLHARRKVKVLARLEALSARLSTAAVDAPGALLCAPYALPAGAWSQAQGPEAAQAGASGQDGHAEAAARLG